MTAPNANTLWADAIVDELATNGITSVVIAPGSRSTPLTMAFARNDSISTYSILDERSAAYFALGRGRMTGTPTPVVTTSGTATANLHPAVMEADTGRVPLLLLTADRPPALQESGANQTVDQTKLYGDTVRWFRDPGLPEANARALRSLRTTINRAVQATIRPPAGPVHLNFPFRKPLEPVDIPDEVPTDFETESPNAATGRYGSYVTVQNGDRTPSTDQLTAIADAFSRADRPLIVCGPTDPNDERTNALNELAATTNAPILADPLSGLRFGDHVNTLPIIGHYDAYLTEPVTNDWPDPDIVIRFGASPTSKRLRQYLGRIDARQILVDPAGDWREAEFTATDLVVGAITPTARTLTKLIESPGIDQWRSRWRDADNLAIAEIDSLPYSEGRLMATLVANTPPETTLFISNSTPIRDIDRFGTPQPNTITTLGNRGASGIDGITSTALGAASTTPEHLVLVIGDVAYYHDMNGLLTSHRCDIDATIVLINNDGGGIFHMLPIEEYDPPFTDHFRTPHGLDFEPSTTLYNLEYTETTTIDEFTTAYTDATTNRSTTVIETVTDAETSHRDRETYQDRVTDQLR